MLSKKKSRPITINDEVYRWSIAPDGEYVTLVVQNPETNGQKLEIIIKTDTGRYWLEFPHTDGLNVRAVTPSLVSDLIDKSSKIGWQPTSKLPPLELTLDDNNELQIRRGLADN